MPSLQDATAQLPSADQHVARNNGSTTAETIATFLLPVGAPLHCNR